jgi:hypothetical protein
LIEPGDTGSPGHVRWLSEEYVLLQHYLIVGHSSKGLELPHIFSDSGDEMLPVFSSEEAAREFLSLSPLGEGWCVRGFSAGELVSLIFAFHAGMKGVLLDPNPGVLSGDVMVSLVEREAFMGSVLEPRRYPPAVGARSWLSVATAPL